MYISKKGAYYLRDDIKVSAIQSREVIISNILLKESGERARSSEG